MRGSSGPTHMVDVFEDGSLADPRRRHALGARPLRPNVFLISCSFSEILANRMLARPLEGWRPSYEEYLDPPPPFNILNICLKHSPIK